jgi:hypothetical protein
MFKKIFSLLPVFFNMFFGVLFLGTSFYNPDVFYTGLAMALVFFLNAHTIYTSDKRFNEAMALVRRYDAFIDENFGPAPPDGLYTDKDPTDWPL